MRKAQAEAGDIVLLFAEGKALTHPYLAQAKPQEDRDGGSARSHHAHWLTIEWLLRKYAFESNDIEPVWRELSTDHLAHPDPRQH